MIKKLRNKVIKMAEAEITAAAEPWPVITITKPVPDCQPTLNQQCMFNAVNEYKIGRAVAVLEVVRVPSTIAHYLCMDDQGLIYDPTLGWPYSADEYRLNRYIHPEEDCFFAMVERLKGFKSELVSLTSKRTKRLMWILRMTPGDVC